MERGRRYEIALEAKVEDEEEADAFRTEVLDVATRVDGKLLSLHLQVPVVLKDRIEVSPSKSVYVHRKETASLRDGGAPVEKTLDVQSIGGPEHTFRIQDALSREGSFALKVETVTPGKHYRLLVTLATLPQEGKRFLKDSIELRTDDPLVPTLVIPAMAQF